MMERRFCIGNQLKYYFSSREMVKAWVRKSGVVLTVWKGHPRVPGLPSFAVPP